MDPFPEYDPCFIAFLENSLEYVECVWVQIMFIIVEYNPSWELALQMEKQSLISDE